eukprot:gnl/TRDRNA2_/TRDRNA2_190629_c0_seq1.p1 gnl/TRDRNA2_/TRDRNA2_190629_c0~~gnl/TRDRNA2_/TRDRNA2_190629_c0_seq1.p1  ORF type:complete len:216 (+),score=59.62 gnl/TRDRNA2_/TRDRNA2_190629_c0_seq1:104-751(+)
MGQASCCSTVQTAAPSSIQTEQAAAQVPKAADAKAPAAAPTNGAEHHYQKKAPQAIETDAQSEGGSSHASQTSSQMNEMTKDQRVEAKRIIKEFVKSMVKGKGLAVVTASGKIRNCFVSLSRQLDKLKIKANAQEKQAREVLLADIDEIVAGAAAGESAACEGLETPLDDLTVTLALTSEECITFRMPDVEQRDTFVMCLSYFANQAKTGASEAG